MTLEFRLKAHATVSPSVVLVVVVLVDNQLSIEHGWFLGH